MRPWETASATPPAGAFQTTSESENPAMHATTSHRCSARSGGTEPGPRLRNPRRPLLRTLLVAGLIGVPAAGLTQPPAPPPAVTGSESVGADSSGNEAAKKLYTLHDLPELGKPPHWAGEAQLGYSASSGNSDTANVNANFLISYTAFPWRHYFGGEVRFAETDGATTKERYAVAYKPEYYFARRWFAFGFLGYDRDPFSNIEARYSATAGVGHALIDTDRQTLILQLGGGYRITQFTDDTPESEEPVGRAGFNYALRVTDTVNFTQELSVLSGSDNTFVESITALQVSMTNNLALSLNYTVLNNSFTPPGVDSTDTFTSVNLVAAF
jgi:putative salt-induced outer membrane protein